MKNSKGFVLAETLMVTVFLMIIFSMIFNNFYPIIGEYEKRETYDDIDSKYSIYWIKKMIEDSSYITTASDKTSFTNNGYAFFSCLRINDADKRATCQSLMDALEVNNAGACKNNDPNYSTTNKTSYCNIYITRYRIGGNTDSKFKTTVKNDYNYYTFNSGFQDYITTLPDYTAPSINFARYRVFVVFYHRKPLDKDPAKINQYLHDYYSYATIEVNR